MKFLVFLILATAVSGCDSSEAPRPNTSRDHGTHAETPGSTLDTETPAAPVARLRFASSLAEAKDGAFSSSFRLLAQRDIVTKFELPTELLAGEVVLLHFELRNPAGVAHASKWYAVSTGADAPATIQHPTFEKAVPVQQAQTEAGVASFYGKIPVAGTNFTRSRLHGEFTATLSLGIDAAEPTAMNSFVMEL